MAPVSAAVKYSLERLRFSPSSPLPRQVLNRMEPVSYTHLNGFYMINGDYPLGVNAARTFFTKYASFSGTVLQVG